MEIKENKYIVLEGSIENRPSASSSIINLKQTLIDNEILKYHINKNTYVFTSDYIFTSPSYAATAIAGGNENGRRQWKYRGENLNELEFEAIK